MPKKRMSEKKFLEVLSAIGRNPKWKTLVDPDDGAIRILPPEGVAKRFSLNEEQCPITAVALHVDGPKSEEYLSGITASGWRGAATFLGVNDVLGHHIISAADDPLDSLQGSEAKLRERMLRAIRQVKAIAREKRER